MANIWIERGIVSEMRCGSNFAYLLNDSSDFLSTEYKVLQSHIDDTFIKCMKMLYNGKVQIYYLTGTLRPLETMLPQMESDAYLTVIVDLIKKVIGVKNIGFLPCQNIILSAEHIYVDPGTLEVSLAYLPVRDPDSNDILSFENRLRASLVKQLQDYEKLNGPKTRGLIGLLQEGTLGLEGLLDRIKDGKGEINKEKTPAKAKPAPVSQLILRSRNSFPLDIQFLITKSGFVIGRDAVLATGVIPADNKKVGRTHCRIDKRENGFWVVDLKSKNGTFLNDGILEAGKASELKGGDILKLADLEFQVSVK